MDAALRQDEDILPERRMYLPVEIIERILSWSSGGVLLAAVDVDPTWHQIVKNLTEKTPIWRWCCNEEIPKEELGEYLQKYCHPLDPNKWLYIYKNWCSWKNIGKEVSFEISLSPCEIPRITCIAVYGQGDFIAVGSEDGRVRCYNSHWKPLFVKRHFSCRVMKITFIYDEDRDYDPSSICMLVAYQRQLVLVEHNKMADMDLILYDVKSHSVYKKNICYEQLGGRIVISKLLKDPRTDENYLEEKCFVRIYSPAEVTCLNMWDGACTCLLGNEVKTIRYDDDIAPMTNFKKRAHIKFSAVNLSKDPRNCYIYRDNIIISLTDEALDISGQFIELFILNGGLEYSKKLFNVWEVLHSFITCMFLYGSTFIIGVLNGIVYFYHVPSWKHFDIRKYQKRVIVGQHPIIGIDVKESSVGRKFYVTSTFNIHEIVGFTSPLGDL